MKLSLTINVWNCMVFLAPFERAGCLGLSLRVCPGDSMKMGLVPGFAVFITKLKKFDLPTSDS